MKTINLILTELTELAEDDCICTEDQQTGKDPTVCKPCDAGECLNILSASIREIGRKFGIE